MVSILVKTFRNFIIYLLFFYSISLNILHEFEKDSEIVVEIQQQHEKEKQCIVEALWYEARGEGREGMKAVLSVIKNRKDHPKYPSTWCGIVHQPKQFSYRNDTIPGKAIKIVYKQHEAQDLKVATSLAEKAVYGAFKPILGPSVIYYHTKKVKPVWSKKLEKAATIGNHVFFNERKNNVKI